MPAIGILASIVGIFVVRATPKDRSAMAPINRGLLTSAVLTIIGTFFVAQFYVHNLKVFWAVFTGVVLGPGGQPHHRVLHVDRDHAGPGHRRVGPHRTGHHGAVRHQHRPGVVDARP